MNFKCECGFECDNVEQLEAHSQGCEPCRAEMDAWRKRCSQDPFLADLAKLRARLVEVFGPEIAVSARWS